VCGEFCWESIGWSGFVQDLFRICSGLYRISLGFVGPPGLVKDLFRSDQDVLRICINFTNYILNISLALPGFPVYALGRVVRICLARMVLGLFWFSIDLLARHGTAYFRPHTQWQSDISQALLFRLEFLCRVATHFPALRFIDRGKQDFELHNSSFWHPQCAVALEHMQGR
jgi:hypothetical protein